jgi:hypothetical protein
MDLARARCAFEGPVDSDEGPIYRLRHRRGLDQEAPRTRPFSMFIVETTQVADGQVARVPPHPVGLPRRRRPAAARCRSWVLRWSLQPLRRWSANWPKVERGAAERLDGDYPRELAR